MPSLLGRTRALLLLVFALGLAAYAWDRGPDPWIDFGRELYVPWRLTEGDRLHRELAWFNGPLSPWWNALCMQLGGVSFDTLQVVNLALALAAGALLRRLVRACTGPLAADVAAFVFFPVFAFAQPIAIGNYTFLAPYSHCLVHGFVLALVSLAALHEARRRRSAAWCALGGFALGLTFLTKAEPFLAGAAASALALAFAAAPSRVSARVSARFVAAFALAFVVPLVAAWLRLRHDLAPAEAWRALLGTWVHALDSRLSGLHFYREMRGTDQPREALQVMLRVACVLAVAFAAAFGAARAAQAVAPRLPKPLRLLEFPALAAFGVGGTVAALWWLPLEPVLRPLPLGLIAVAALALRDIVFGDTAARDQGVTALTLAVFGGLLLAKLGLKPSVREYGFVLAAPGTALAVATLVHRAPNIAGRAAPGLRAAVVGALVALALLHLNTTHTWFSRRTLAVGSGGDHFWTQPWRAFAIEALVAEVEARVPKDGTLLVLPEGVSLNYWTKRRTPIAVYNFMPPELIMFGEEALVRELEAHPPDAVVLVSKETPEYGFRFFGQGYGEHLTAWLRAHYREVTRYGAAPLTSREWGAAVYVPK